MMKNLLNFILVFAVLIGSACSALAQDSPKLTGDWEVFVGSTPTGIILTVEQRENRLRAKYKTVKAGNKYGLQPGDPFFLVTLNGETATGKMKLRKGDIADGGQIETTDAQLAVIISGEGQLMKCRISGDGVKDSERRFDLRRMAKVENMRIYVSTPDGLKPAGKMIEGVPMVVDLEFATASKRDVTVKLENGENTLELEASALEEVSEDGDGKQVWHCRTDPFIVSYGTQLGAPTREVEERESEEDRRDATEADWAEIAGVWKTVYRDMALGEVTGFIRIFEWGGGEFQYRHPETNRLVAMSLKSATVADASEPPLPPGDVSDEGDPDGDVVPTTSIKKWRLILDGQGVHSEKVDFDMADYPILKLQVTGTDPLPVVVSADRLKAELGLELPQAADLRQVELNFDRVQEGGLMVWDWHYKAKRATARDAEGLGRVGIMRPLADNPDATIGLQKGKEVWMKDAPGIIDSVCLDDQVEVVDDPAIAEVPVARYRYAASTPPGTTYEVARSGNLTRKVFVVAHGLQPESMGRIKLVPDETSGVERYMLIARGTEELPGNQELREAWKSYREVRPARDEAVATPREEIEGLLVTAVLKSDAPPGYQAFKIGETGSEWNLQYGDTLGKLEVVRKIADEQEYSGDVEPREWESAPNVFVPEQVRAAVEVTAEIDSQKQITVAIAIEHKDGSETEFLSWKGEKKIPLTRDPNDRKRYLSPIIELVRKADLERIKSAQPNDIVVAVGSGDKIKLMAGPDSGYQMRPLIAEAQILQSPEEMNALWKSALKKAADLAGQPIEDWNEVARGQADQVNNFIVTEFWLESGMTPSGFFSASLKELARAGDRAGFTPPLENWWGKKGGGAVKSIDISIGDHAAMLLLRTVFIEMMEEQHADWSRNRASGKIRNIYLNQKSQVASKRSPLSFFKVKLRNLQRFRYTHPEEEAYLYELFDDSYLKDDLDVRSGDYGLEDVKWEAFRHAYLNWGAAMRSSIEEARAISDADVGALMKLTGYGFESIVQRLLPRMMKLENVGPQQARWVPDRVARAYCTSLYVLGNAIKAQQDYSKIDTTFAMTAISLATIPLGNVGGFWSAAAVLSLSVADAAYGVYTDIYQSDQAEADLETEVGMGAVLGYGRAAAKRGEITEGWQKALAVAGGGLGVLTDGVTAVKAVRNLSKASILAEGAELLKKVDFANPATLKSLSKYDQAVLKRFLDNADAAAAAGKLDDLSDAQRAALRHSDELKDIFEESGVAAAAADRASTLTERARPVKTKEIEEIATELDGTIAKTERQVENAKGSLESAKKAAARADEAGDPAAKARAGKRVQDAEDKLTNTKDALGEYKQRRDVVSNMVEKSKKRRPVHHRNPDGSGGVSYVKDKVRLTNSDVDLLRSRRPQLSPADKRRVEQLLRQNDGDWNKLKKMAGKTPEDQLDLHRVATYRRNLVNKLAEDSMAETKALLEANGVKDVNLRRAAFGSTNLTSDYDVAIKGRGAELAVDRFNQKVRKVFGGRESGTAVDTNLYTDPVYNEFKAANLKGTELGVDLSKGDSLNQFMFQQMANVKYRDADQWQTYRRSLVDGLAPDARKAMDRVLDQAEGAKTAADELLKKRIASMGDDVLDVGDNKTLRATNEIYGETLTDIHHYRSLIDDLDQVGVGAKKAADVNLPPELGTRKFAKTLETIDELMASGNPKKVKQAKEALEQLRNRAAVNVRNKQGLALYFASEAYQTRGTISHVVGELQAKGIKLDPTDLLDGKVRQTDLKVDDYVNSYFENGANLIKELRGKKVFDESGQLITGHAKMDDAAQKTAKYFERQLDAANQAGVKFRETGIDAIDDVVKGTVELNAVRSDATKFAKKLEELGWSSEDYVRNAMSTMKTLDQQVMGKSGVVDIAKDVMNATQEAERKLVRDARLNGAMTAVGKSGNIKTVLYPPSQFEEIARGPEEKALSEELRGLENKQAVGNFLSNAQKQRIKDLRQTELRQNEMETLSRSARAAGVPDAEVRDLLNQKRTAGGSWREAAAKELEQKLEDRLQRQTVPRLNDNTQAKTDPRLLRELGIDGGEVSSKSRDALAEQIRKSGKKVTVPKNVNLESLDTHAKAGNKPLVVMRDQEGREHWVEFGGVEKSQTGREWIEVIDPESGASFRYPKSLFMQRSGSLSQTVIVDPHQTPSGKWQKTPKKEATLEENIRSYLPMVGE